MEKSIFEPKPNGEPSDFFLKHPELDGVPADMSKPLNSIMERALISLTTDVVPTFVAAVQIIIQ